MRIKHRPFRRTASRKAENRLVNAKPLNHGANSLLQLQQRIGNQAVGQFIQARFTTSPPAGSFEDGADRVVDSGRGEPLPEAMRSFFEPRFGQDLGHVRVHHDDQANNSARDINALAYTVGNNIVFGAGQYAPQTNDGRHLLAHELTHVVQQTRRTPQAHSSPRVIQRSPFVFPTNYRFDTYQLTEEDLRDPNIIARFEAMNTDGLRSYRDKVSDLAVRVYIGQLIAIRTRAEVETNHAAYLEKVQAAVAQIGAPGSAAETFSDVFFPLLKELSKASNVTWRDEAGVETGGKSFQFKPPGKGSKKIKLRLVLDEADPKKEKRRGYFSASNGEIGLIVRRATTIDEIRATLFHESLHMAFYILESQGAAALGDPEATKFLETALNRSEDIKILKKIVFDLQISLNGTRRARGAPTVPAEKVDLVTKELWEEITVRAETFYFELKHWEQSSTGDVPPLNYLSQEGLTEVYLKQTYQFLNDADLAALTEDQKDLLVQLFTFLRYRMRSLIKAHGVSNAFVPHPLEPQEPAFVIERADIDPGPIVPLESLRPDVLKETLESVKRPPF